MTRTLKFCSIFPRKLLGSSSPDLCVGFYSRGGERGREKDGVYIGQVGCYRKAGM